MPRPSRRLLTPTTANKLNNALQGILAALDKSDDSERLLARSIRAYMLDAALPDGTSHLELVIHSLVEQATKGNIKATALLFERMEGKAAANAEDDMRVQKIALLVSQLAPQASAVPRKLIALTNGDGKLSGVENPHTTDKAPGDERVPLPRPRSEHDFESEHMESPND